MPVASGPPEEATAMLEPWAMAAPVLWPTKVSAKGAGASGNDRKPGSYEFP